MILITHSTIVVRALFHHMCLQLTVDFGTHISSFGEYALAFVEQGVFLFAYVRFSRNDELCRVIRRTGPTLGPCRGPCRALLRFLRHGCLCHQAYSCQMCWIFCRDLTSIRWVPIPTAWNPDSSTI